jgi:hypothetical protein
MKVNCPLCSEPVEVFNQTTIVEHPRPGSLNNQNEFCGGSGLELTNAADHSIEESEKFA